MAEPTTSNELHDSAKECAVPANLNQLKHDLHAAMTTMMSEMMSTMKDDMLQQFEDYFAPSETWLNDSPHSNTEGEPNNIADANEPNDTSGAFDDLAAEFSTTDKAGPPVDGKLADIITDLLQNPLPKAKLDELVTKYPRPENCQSLVAPKINKMVWQKLKPDTRTTDGSMQRCQKLFISAIYAIIDACASSTDQIRTVLTHALVLALSGNRELNLRRRELLRPQLNSQYAALCNPSIPITTELFGDNITKEIEDVTKANQLSTKLSSSRRDRRQRYHPYTHSSSYYNTNVTKENTGRVPSRRNFQSFFANRGTYRRRPGTKTGATSTRSNPN